MIQILGIVAACLTTASFLPQAVQVIKTKETKGISFAMYLMFTTGILLWLIYGVMIKNIPIIAANSVTFVLAFIVLVMKIKHK